jgi:C-terminal processing protease CtpA/Prc
VAVRSRKFSIKTSELTKKFWKDINDTTIAVIKDAIMSHRDGEVFDVPLPTFQPRTDSLRFTGRVYVLVNRYSYSEGTTVPALIQDYGFGNIVGETTADCPTLYAAIHDFKLPHTQLRVSYPKAFMVRPNGNTETIGVVPDYPVKEDFYGKDDNILDYALRLIKENKF